MLYLILEWRATAQFIVGLMTCAAMLRWGGGPERSMAWVWLALVLGDKAYHLILNPVIRFDDLDVGHALLDTGACFAMIGIALYANRIYPLWIAAFQVVAMSAHVAREIAEAVTPLAYVIMTIAPSYFQLVTMMLGLYFHIRRTRKIGAYRDWRNVTPVPA